MYPTHILSVVWPQEKWTSPNQIATNKINHAHTDTHDIHLPSVVRLSAMTPASLNL